LNSCWADEASTVGVIVSNADVPCIDECSAY